MKRGFEAIRANRSNDVKHFSQQTDSRESPRFALRIAEPSKSELCFTKNDLKSMFLLLFTDVFRRLL